LRQLGAHPRQLLAVIGGKLGQIQFIDQRFQARRFRLQTKILRLGQRRIAGLRADAALNLIELATGIGLLLRQLVEESAISRARSCSCWAWRLASSSWLLTCRISWFSASEVRPVGTWRGSSLRLLSCARSVATVWGNYR
jgi:hypothetical protein